MLLMKYKRSMKRCWHVISIYNLAQNVVSAILNRVNVCMVNVYYKFALISQDMDDNKFVDCAIAASARYIVT